MKSWKTFVKLNLFSLQLPILFFLIELIEFFFLLKLAVASMNYNFSAFCFHLLVFEQITLPDSVASIDDLVHQPKIC